MTGTARADRPACPTTNPLATYFHRAGRGDGAKALPLGSTSRRNSWFQLGDVCLNVVSDEEDFFDEFEEHYHDCVLAKPRHDLVQIRCNASRLQGTSLLCLSFEGASLPAPLSAAGTPFRMLRHLARYVDVLGPARGWRMLVDAEGDDRMLVAGDEHRLVIDLNEAPAEFATDCVVSLVQAAQPEVLFLHAASFGIAGAGALLAGCGMAGKSTTALALAARGHSFLGDDVAAIRTSTRELLPFPRAVRLRPCPNGCSVEARLRAARYRTAVGRDGMARTIVSMGELFPGSVGGALPLRFAFLLDGFGVQPRLTPFRPEIADARRLRAVVSESIPSWGLSPGRDLMKFLAVVNVLSGLDCYRVELGSTKDSAAAIEERMEAKCHST